MQMIKQNFKSIEKNIKEYYPFGLFYKHPFG
jgi:hypothetical protein